MCAQTWDALPVQSYPLGQSPKNAKTLEFALDSHGSCLLVGDKPVPAILIRIDQNTRAIALKLTSVSSKEATLPAHIALLDEKFLELKSYPFDRFTKRGMDYTFTLFLPASEQPRYLLATPDSEWVGRTNQLTSGNRWTTVWVTAAVMGTYSDGNERRTTVPFAVFGKLRVETEDDLRLITPASSPSH
jgi:hypothetical protein